MVEILSGTRLFSLSSMCMTIKSLIEVQLAEGVSLSELENVGEATSFIIESIRHWAECALHGERSNGQLTMRLVSVDEIQALNRDYRNKDAPTNVLSFPMELPAGYAGDENILGDIAICMDVVVEEAQQQAKPVMHHLAHMVVHGCLHVLGYDHQTDEQAMQMENLERAVLAQFHIPDPYENLN